MNKIITISLLCLIAGFTACKGDFLDVKPSSNIVVPKTLPELQGLLENQTMMNVNGGLGHVSADDLEMPDDKAFNAISSSIMRNTYLWKKDIYEGNGEIPEWNKLYLAVFYANNVLAELNKNTYSDTKVRDKLHGWALFFRANAFYDLVCSFSPVYNETTAATALGIPLRLLPEIDYVEPRATVKQTFDKILTDLTMALQLIPNDLEANNPNRPSKAGVNGLLARIYLYMGKYEAALKHAEAGLSITAKLTDFNTLSLTASSPFGIVSDESIWYSMFIGNLIDVAFPSGSVRPYSVRRALLDSYVPDDLRKQIYFVLRPQGNYNAKPRYINGPFVFTGIAVPELMLIKAECLARNGAGIEALKIVDNLLVKRYKAGKYIPKVYSTEANALNIVLEERQKELIWRGLRWTDLKRFNRDGMNITLTRTVNGTLYSLPPNDPRYVFPIPVDEINRGGIQQNER